MKLQKSKLANINYLAKIINIKEFSPHPNSEVTRMKIAYVDGYSICMGIDEKPGFYVYFPTLCKINPNLLAYSNLYRDKELNNDPTKTGFFENSGKVKAIKLKGVLSEGFLLPFVTFSNWIIDSVNIELPEQPDGLEFDEIEHNGKTFWVNKKYITQSYTKSKSNKRDKTLKKFNRIREDQFHFHYDTVILKKEPYAIQPDDIIHISGKIHGTSGISAYVLCHKPLNWKQRIAKWLTKESFDKYDYIYASRSVIKNKYYNEQVSDGFYGCDVWTEADKVIQPHLEKGMTAYYEIVGFLPNGKYIQKDYDYGCSPSTTHYIEGENFKVYLYRITTVNVDGKIHEWSTREVKQFCEKNNLRCVQQYYYGYAKDLYPELDVKQHWTQNFLEKLANDKNFYMELNSPDCVNSVPHEGIVIKKEDGISHAWKVKSFKFLNKEQSSNEINIEDNS